MDFLKVIKLKMKFEWIRKEVIGILFQKSVGRVIDDLLNSLKCTGRVKRPDSYLDSAPEQNLTTRTSRCRLLRNAAWNGLRTFHEPADDGS